MVRTLLEHQGRMATLGDAAEVVSAVHRCEVVDRGSRGFSLDVLR